VKPRISRAAALTAVMALRHLDARLAPLEARLGLSGAGNGQASDIDRRFAEAEQKRIAMAKEAHISKIEKMAEQHEAGKEPSDNLEPAKAEDQPEDKDDRYKFGRFDPSSGAQAQATPRHPMGGNSKREVDMKPTRDSLHPAALLEWEDRLQAVERRLAGAVPKHPIGDALNWHQIEAARERAVMRGWISAITEYNTRRWA
jgi:hypothetical protein